MVTIEPELIWGLVLGFVVAFILALAMGGNDVANTFGTSVGAKVLTLRQACICATFCETLGAVLMGAKVSDTVRTGIVNVMTYENQTQLYLAGNVAALSGSGIWLLIATVLKLPVSTSHSVIGASIGYALVAHGTKGIKWMQLASIVISWFASPLFAGILSLLTFIFCQKFILNKSNTLESGLAWLPVFYATTFFVNILSVLYMVDFQNFPAWALFLVSFGAGAVIAIFVRLILVPYQRKTITARIDEEMKTTAAQVVGNSENSKTDSESPVSHDNQQADVEKIQEKKIASEKTPLVAVNKSTQESDAEKAVKPVSEAEGCDDPVDTRCLFSFLMILTALFGSFAHGGNDVSNSVGPLVSIWMTTSTGHVSEDGTTPRWLLLYGGVGITIGLWLWGRRVIETVGKDIVQISPSSGFPIEFGSALTALLASNTGFPISTTHCKVGAVVAVGYYRWRKINWHLFGGILFAWLVTVPVAAGASAALMAIMMQIVPTYN